MKKTLFSLFFILSLTAAAFSDPFNSKLTASEREQIASGEILIKNINYEKFMCLQRGESELGDKLLAEIRDLLHGGDF